MERPPFAVHPGSRVHDLRLLCGGVKRPALSSKAVEKAGPPHTLVGRNLKDIGIPPSPSRAPRLIFFGRNECEPCQQARAYLQRNPFAAYDYLEAIEDGEQPPKMGLSWRRRPATISTTPVFLVVAGDGTILAQDHGWSNDDLWIRAFRARILNELPNAARKQK